MRRFLQLEFGLFVLSALTVGFFWLFSTQALWILGSQYRNLNTEVVLNILGSCLSLIAGITFTLCAGPKKLSIADRSHLFHICDQDALNAAAMCSESQISEMGPEGMDFIHGGWTMAHAAGSKKPWRKNYVLDSLKGNVPTSSNRTFWMNAAYPIPAYLNNIIKLKKTCILFGSFVGRFYRRY